MIYRESNLTDRQKRLLKAVIEHYQASGEPVSSKWLAENADFTESSATIRAELNQLESMDYLEHMHTSGARLPTVLGYRFYIDDCLRQDLLNDPVLTSFIKNAYDQYAGDPFAFSRAIGIFVAKRLSMPVISALDDGLDCWKGGLSYIQNYEEMLESNALMPIISFIDQFEYIFAPFIDRLNISGPISVSIGEENAGLGLNSVALIVAQYPLPGQRRGKLVIVGPMRMAYQNTLPYISNIVHELFKLNKNY